LGTAVLAAQARIAVFLICMGIAHGVLSERDSLAQASFPGRSVKFIVPSPPGTMIDLLPRMLGEKLSARWGHPVVVENRSGAAHNLAAEAIARAEPDGHTLLVTPPAPLVLNQWLDPGRESPAAGLVPVTLLANFPQVLVVNPKVPVANFQEWIAYARANPGRMSYGSPGTGTTAQLAQEELMRALGIKLVHVPYQGMAPAINDLLAGHIETMFAAVGTVTPHIEDGKLRPLALTGGERLARLPGIPVISEMLPAFNHVEWFAIVAPPRTPAPTAFTLWQAISDALRSPDVEDRLRRAMVAPAGFSPAQTAAFIEGERQRWRAIVEARKADPDSDAAAQ
jgi:tripartite-type tricarboxylate transporter receptor subunit TctC